MCIYTLNVNIVCPTETQKRLKMGFEKQAGLVKVRIFLARGMILISAFAPEADSSLVTALSRTRTRHLWNREVETIANSGASGLAAICFENFVCQRSACSPRQDYGTELSRKNIQCRIPAFLFIPRKICFEICNHGIHSG